MAYKTWTFTAYIGSSNTNENHVDYINEGSIVGSEDYILSGQSGTIDIVLHVSGTENQTNWKACTTVEMVLMSAPAAYPRLSKYQQKRVVSEKITARNSTDGGGSCTLTAENASVLHAGNNLYIGAVGYDSTGAVVRTTNMQYACTIEQGASVEELSDGMQASITALDALKEQVSGKLDVSGYADHLAEIPVVNAGGNLKVRPVEFAIDNNDNFVLRGTKSQVIASIPKSQIEGVSSQSFEAIKQDIAGAKQELEDKTSKLKEDKIDKPLTSDNGKILRAKNGNAEWVEQGLPSDAQTETAVNNWLNEHPEATTTVKDNSISINKLIVGTLGYVTPEMFGAVGDGVADDSDAIEKTLSSNKNIAMKDGAIYKICRSIIPNATKIHIDGHGAKITADDTFSYTQNACYGFFQFQVNANDLTEFVVKNLDIDIKTNGILYGERTAGDERSCPIFRIKNTKNILIDNCSWVIASNTGNRAVLWSDGLCDGRVSITSSNFENKCAGNAGGVIAINMRNDLKDITSFMSNCSLITDSCDELYSIQNTGASNLYSVIESCVFINHGGFIKNNSTKQTIVVATNHTGTGKLHMNINATKIEYDGQSTNLMKSTLTLSSTSHAHQNIVLRGCTISNPYGRAIEGAYSKSGSPEYLHVNAEKCDIISGKSTLNDVVDGVGDLIITDCNITGESYISYFYPSNYTNRFVVKNSKVYLKNPIGVLFVYNRKGHIVEICGNVYHGNYTSKAYKNDAIDPDAPNIDLEDIKNNVYVTTI